MLTLEQPTTTEIRAKMDQALTLLKEALNSSLPLLRSEQKDRIILLWESFLREFFSYAKQKSRETGANFMSLISFHRIWLK